MKTIPLQMLLVCSSLLPITQLQAAGPAGKKFGGLTAGKKFTLTVQEATSSQTRGTKVNHKAPIPDGIPKFTKGQKIKFAIGNKGELKGPGFSIAYLSSSANANSYAKLPSSKTVSPNGAAVFKSSTGQPVGATMTFYQYRISDYTPAGLSINLVGYVLK